MSRTIFVGAVLLLCAAAICDMSCDKPPAPPAAKPTHRLYRVEIPAGSRYREVDWDSRKKEPDLRLCLLRKGNPIGQVSETKTGWESEFSDTNAANHFAVDGSDDATFSLNLYDADSSDPDDLILSITGLTATDFDKAILEKLSPNDPADRAVRIEFKRIQ